MREKSTMVFGNRVFSGADSGAADQQLMEILDFTKKNIRNMMWSRILIWS